MINVESSKRIHVLQCTTKLCTGGVQTFLTDYLSNIDRDKIIFDFAVQTNEPQRYDDDMRNLGCRIFPVTPMKRSQYQYYRDIVDICKNHPEIQIVHSHMNFRNFLPLLAAKRAGVTRRISHSHNSYEASGVMKRIARNMYQLLLSTFATDYWGCSEKANKWLYGRYAKESIVIHNAIPVERYKFDKIIREKQRKMLGLSENEVAIVHIGTFGMAKNHKFLIDMFSKYQKIHTNTKLLLCGDGGLRSDIKKQVADNNLDKSVIMLGMVSNVSEILMASDVFVLPSLFEGLPISTIEAQASGLPCVVSGAVPNEAIFKNNVIKCFGFKIDKWVQSIEEVQRFPKERGTKDIMLATKAGFNIENEAERLERLYLNNTKESDMEKGKSRRYSKR